MRSNDVAKLRGIKESPPYIHDGRCLTLEDTVEFVNLVLQTWLKKEEKSDLVAFMRQMQGGVQHEYFACCPKVGKL